MTNQEIKETIKKDILNNVVKGINTILNNANHLEKPEDILYFQIWTADFAYKILGELAGIKDNTPQRALFKKILFLLLTDNIEIIENEEEKEKLLKMIVKSIKTYFENASTRRQAVKDYTIYLCKVLTSLIDQPLTNDEEQEILDLLDWDIIPIYTLPTENI